ncbi:hypothetical protein BHE74_00057955 [Ensete ventricosum]|nr:hypothetical protein GW17_00023592 [Ensete ventricosum]RWW36980.1 hypothetical protein BHE74_00057955 [Ensete ventricosum]
MVVNNSSLSVLRHVRQQEASKVQVPVTIYKDGKLGVASPMEIPVSDINDEADRFIQIIWTRRFSRNSTEHDASMQSSTSARSSSSLPPPLFPVQEMDKRNDAAEPLGICQRLLSFLVPLFKFKQVSEGKRNINSIQQQEETISRVPVTILKDGKLGVASPTEVLVEYQKTKDKAAASRPPIRVSKITSNIDDKAARYIERVIKSRPQDHTKKSPCKKFT